MIRQHNFSLKHHNTFGIDVNATSYIEISAIQDLVSYFNSKSDNEECFILGGGSNMLLTSDIEKTVLHINIKGKKFISQNEDYAIVEAAAGENWHDFVVWTIENNLGGIENLSLIPGNCGTAPIQNIGAYGVELKDSFVKCEAFDISSSKMVEFSNVECAFGYRDSIFKNEAKNKYIITSIQLKLSTNDHKIKNDYGAIKSELESHGISNPTIKDISDAVINIRNSKLPNPKEIGNSGSFFKNPVINNDDFNKLKEQYPNVPSYVVDEEHTKVPAGWLIETAGFKGKNFGTYGVHEKQALVLVNYGNADGKDIKDLAHLIQHTISRLFGIELEVEVNIF
ncbi:MAG: UDP-N-acetylmuramate dehydrogenase [bacterium]